MTRSGSCVRCGAPIYSVPKPGEPDAVPQTVFTCPCHQFLQCNPWPYFPPVFPPQPAPVFIPTVFPAVPPFPLDPIVTCSAPATEPTKT